ncbi:hypothetical protein KKF91_02610 [Myxococcota bacterium]|nr:hypothetical protein [Myxococcota bacterium]MBU1429432.1 hypothetical protein [Myxococcota bacterium]MBU1898800.1 hypothetical protein [Myxococcota bacterium]
MADKPSWRERDRRKDSSAHRDHAPTRPAPRVESATASYKRQLDAFFNEGKVPAHLRDKLPEGEASPNRRQALLREIRKGDAAAQQRAVQALRDEFGLPDDPEILLIALSHPDDAILRDALDAVEALLATGRPLPKKALFRLRLSGLEFSAFDPSVQRRSAALAARLV